MAKPPPHAKNVLLVCIKIRQENQVAKLALLLVIKTKTHKYLANLALQAKVFSYNFKFEPRDQLLLRT